MPLDLVIRGGTIVTADSTARGDVGVRDGKIVSVSEDLPADGAREIDASGLLVTPGAIDVHTHFDTRVGQAATADDFESGSRAAAAGGITSFVNFAFQTRGQALRAAAEEEVAKGAGRSHLDYGVHLVITDPDTPGVLDEIGPLAGEGFTSLKIFTAVSDFCLDDGQILRVLDRAAREGVMVNVHAEDEALIAHPRAASWAPETPGWRTWAR